MQENESVAPHAVGDGMPCTQPNGRGGELRELWTKIAKAHAFING